MSAPDRAEQIAGWRELVDWLEAHPSVPLPWNGMDLFVENCNGISSPVEALAVLRAAAVETGIELYANRHLTLSREFTGGVSYEATVIDFEKIEDLAAAIENAAATS